jgi:hypothetical protein
MPYRDAQQKCVPGGNMAYVAAAVAGVLAVLSAGMEARRRALRAARIRRRLFVDRGGVG